MTLSELQSKMGRLCSRFRCWSQSRPRLPGRDRWQSPCQAALGPCKRLAELGCRGVQVPVLTASKPNGSSFILSHLRMASPLPETELANDCEIFVSHLRPGGVLAGRFQIRPVQLATVLAASTSVCLFCSLDYSTKQQSFTAPAVANLITSASQPRLTASSSTFIFQLAVILISLLRRYSAFLLQASPSF